MDLHVVGAFGLGDGEEFSDVLGASVAEPHGARIVGHIELDLELASVPAGLRGVVVGVDHGVATAYATATAVGHGSPWPPASIPGASATVCECKGMRRSSASVDYGFASVHVGKRSPAPSILGARRPTCMYVIPDILSSV